MKGLDFILFIKFLLHLYVTTFVIKINSLNIYNVHIFASSVNLKKYIKNYVQIINITSLSI